jgi:hypothetical protein
MVAKKTGDYCFVISPEKYRPEVNTFAAKRRYWREIA